MDDLKRRIRAHPAFRGGPADETYWLDLLEVTVREMFPEGLDTLADQIAGFLESHPELWSAHIEASRQDLLAWKTVHTLLKRFRNPRPGSLIVSRDDETSRRGAAALIAWGLDVATGDRTEPPDGSDSRKRALRNGAITATVNGIRDLGELPYESAERRSACHAIADRLGMSYTTVRTIWRNGRRQLQRAREQGLIPPAKKQRRQRALKQPNSHPTC